MKELFEEVQRIDKIGKNQFISIEKALGKAFEECGEFAQAVNRITGMKSHELTPEEVLDFVAEEGADSIQNIFCVLNKCGVSYDALVKKLAEKNSEWEKSVEEAK